MREINIDCCIDLNIIHDQRWGFGNHLSIIVCFDVAVTGGGGDEVIIGVGGAWREREGGVWNDEGTGERNVAGAVETELKVCV